MTVSIGGAANEGESMDELLNLADDALYVPTDQGRNRVVMAVKSAATAEEKGGTSEPAAPGGVS